MHAWWSGQGACVWNVCGMCGMHEGLTNELGPSQVLHVLHVHQLGEVLHQGGLREGIRVCDTCKRGVAGSRGIPSLLKVNKPARRTTERGEPVTTMVKRALSTVRPTARDSMLAPGGRVSRRGGGPHCMHAGPCAPCVPARCLTPPGEDSCHAVDQTSLIGHQDGDDVLLLSLSQGNRLVPVDVAGRAGRLHCSRAGLAM
jgi:hypothetical protein